MKKTLIRLFTLTVLACVGSAGAQEDHAHGSPHGGQVKTAGKGHVEALLEADKLVVYVLDEKERTVAPPKEAKAVLLVGKGKQELQLSARGNALEASLPDDVRKQLTAAQGKATAIVTVSVGGTTQSARFTFTGAQAPAKHDEHHG
ncbi:hypothetical protein [Hyalangium rubrum]|uniref:Uncharacterized protein n=1 Tax=Hyalangium rubrum TaxID=3103134 RepID=A0ABU5H9C6_9BACT|nr:hypothetical protein [Hyalangium sp. s54d21]MDY7229846.1 hypothetical protein [Hyalangium sp. s54d21]